MLNIRPSTRKQAKIKLALQGCAGSGKTYSALPVSLWHDLGLV